MSSNNFNPVEAGAEAIKGVEMDATSLDAGIRSQLSQPTDIQAAHQFFQAGGAENSLPGLSLDSGMPTSFNSPEPGALANLANPNLAPGAESAIGQALTPGLDGGLLPGLEQGALAGVPGSEQISPMIQLILKLPGAIGMVGSFFEALMSFFFPADGGGLLAFLDPTFWAQTAQHAFSSMVTAIAENIPLSFTSLTGNNLFTNLLGNNFFDTLGKTTTGTMPDISMTGAAAPVPDSQALLVNGSVSPGKPLFETSSLDSQALSGGSVNLPYGENQLIAMEGGNSFGPTVGGYQHPTVNVTPDPSQAAPQPTAQPVDASAQAAEAPQAPAENFAPGNESAATADGISHRGELLGQGTGAGENQLASTAPLDQTYTIQHGDNLWNIARDHLGSGSRWTEIYNLNQDVIGANPSLIYGGTELHLPGVDTLSGAQDYVVHSGDNLWNIARDHLGAGKDWTSIYSNNSQVIGANPDLIHPGQKLAIMGGHGNGTVHLAHAPASHSHLAHSAHTAHAHAGHAQTGQAHTGHAQTAHAQSPQAANHQEVAQAHPSAAGAESASRSALEAARKTVQPAERTASLPQTVADDMGLRAVAKSL
ncbi:MAG: LysM peptidoglycan-binding domain-containing protein [Cyanobacteria bacterium HKST-UBA02]|nr:LysM peptidoglycan-binding domain-containing protein [Cyanobacteria bacterium HKST-UBA02]